MIDPTVAEEAVRLVGGDRNDQYGTPEENLGRIARLWSAYTGADISAADVSMMMVLTKVSRSRRSYLRDTSVDGVAYLLMYDSLARGDHGGQ